MNRQSSGAGTQRINPVRRKAVSRGPLRFCEAGMAATGQYSGEGTAASLVRSTPVVFLNNVDPGQRQGRLAAAM
ncbi:unnamed protein product [Cuscuta campestris]|uniref:Uncharacterized protein n=1 Tax=Cuscuta campestris TaxID=132261 RepID=A0A484JZP8_9ASTE|nr:unnamed protein product [Cuscuta campestris]